MNKRIRHTAQNKRLPPTKKATTPVGLKSHASRLCLIGLPLLFLGMSDIAARLYEGVNNGAVGIMLHLASDFESFMAGVAILTGGVLLLDYMERRDAMSK